MRTPRQIIRIAQMPHAHIHPRRSLVRFRVRHHNHLDPIVQHEIPVLAIVGRWEFEGYEVGFRTGRRGRDWGDG